MDFAFMLAAAVFCRPLERVASMDPLRASAVYDTRAVGLVYETPLEVDYASRPYRLVPSLCELPSVSEDGCVWEFRLRPGSRFADSPCFPGGKGRAVVAADIAYSLRRLADPANASGGAWIMKGVKSVEAPDELTLRIVLERPIHYFPWLMAMTYASAVPHEAVEAYGNRFGGIASGSGPYRLVEWRRNHMMRFARNPLWRGWSVPPPCEEARVPGARPYDEIRYAIVDDPSTQWLMFLKGEIDFLGDIPRDNQEAAIGPDGKVSPELAARGIHLESAPTLEVAYIAFNMDDPVVGANRKLRQALNCAFDFAAWRRFFNGRVEPCNGPVPPGVEGRLEEPFAYSFNLDKAKRLLAEAGYPRGIDPATGRRLKLSLAIGRATQDVRESTELMVAFFDRIGVVLEPKYMLWDAFLRSISERREQMFRIGWSGDYPDAHNFLQLFHSKNASPGPNRSNYSSPEFDAHYEAALAAKDEAARNAEWRLAQKVVLEDCPWIFLNFTKSFSLVNPGTLGFRPTDFPAGSEKFLRAAPER